MYRSAKITLSFILFLFVNLTFADESVPRKSIVYNCAARLTRKSISVLEQLNPLIFLSIGYPFRSTPVDEPQIDLIDRELWSLSIANNRKEYGSIEFYDQRGQLLIKRIFSGTTRSITSILINNELNQALEGFPTPGLSRVSKIVLRHTHPMKAGLDGWIIRLPYKFSRGDRLVSYMIRNALSAEPALAHVVFEMDLIYSNNANTVLKKKAYLLEPRRHFFLPE